MSACLGGGAAAAWTPAQLMPPGATVTGQTESGLDSYAMPVGGWSRAGIDTVTAEGRLDQQAWRTDTAPASTLDLLAPMRRALQDQGYEVVFECEDTACGGFDFRYGTKVLPEPDMHVDLGDYRYLAARRGTEDAEDLVSLFVSRSPGAGYIQITRLDEAAASEPGSLVASTMSPGDLVSGVKRDTAKMSDIAALIEAQGRVPLDDLAFSTGSYALGPGDYASLSALADWLKAEPSRRVALVGHTDDEGALDTNIALSKRRAASVRDRLVSSYGIEASRLDARGVGYLAPRTANDSDAGRLANRRVEAVRTQ